MSKKAAPKSLQKAGKDEDGGRSARAVSRYLRIAPRKMRLVIDTIRRRPVSEASWILATLNRRGARVAQKVLQSAVANAKNQDLEESRLYISDIRADGGPSLKRFRPRAMGRADRILKRTTHLSVVVREGKRRSGGTSKDFSGLEAGKSENKASRKGVFRKKKKSAGGKDKPSPAKA